MEDRRVRDDQLRHREVHRYFSLKASSVGLDASCPGPPAPQPSLNPALSAFTQLVAWRLKATLAIISLIDLEYQYPLAVSTIHNPDSDQLRSHPHHELWPGCEKVSVQNLPCEKAVALSSSPDHQSLFIVPDLSNDVCYRQLPVVSGPPFLRFYAGAPIKSPEGIVIGTLFIVDKITRPDLTREEERFLLETAENAAHTMEVARAAVECQRRMKMDTCLDMVLRRNHVRGAAETTTNVLPMTTVDIASAQSQIPPPDNNSKPHTNENPNKSPSIKMSAKKPWSDDKQAKTSHHLQKDGRLSIFNEAADILYTALEIQNSGGVLFLDLTNTESAIFETQVPMDAKPGSTEQNNSLLAHPGSVKQHFIRTEYSPMEAQDYLTGQVHPVNNSHILAAYTTACESLLVGGFGDHADLSFLTKKLVTKLAEAHPNGTLWPSGDQDTTSAEIGHQEQESQPSGGLDSDHLFSADGYLAKCFPKAYQIVFAPIRESSSPSLNIACFCWTESDDLNWSQDLDVNFCLRFGHTLVREVTKLDSVAAENQRKDFVNTISHELRSPLHGILASAELLDETRHDVFQKSLVDTIARSGRTLLDTINQVLDYNMMDSLLNETLGLNLTQVRSGEENTLIINDDEPMTESCSRTRLDICTETNLAGLCEEVISELWAEQNLRGISSAESREFTTYSASSRSAHKPTSYLINSNIPINSSNSQGKTIEVLLDIQRDGWQFLAPRGALCRIIMNIVGNALKYTENGWIRIKLETSNLDVNYSPEEVERTGSSSSIITLTVTDSGKGISAEFLRTKLYTAFAQEDIMAQGAGLGLNLVRRIVTMLHGTINIESQLGTGTEVKVQIPLRRVTPISTESLSPQITSFHFQNARNSIADLQQCANKKSIAIYGSHEGREVKPGTLEGILAYYVTEWFGLADIFPWSALAQGDVTIVDEVNLIALLSQETGSLINLRVPILIVLCNKFPPQSQRAIHTRRGRIVEFVTKPVGPHKLAEALRRGLTRESEAKRKFVNMFSAMGTAAGAFNERLAGSRKSSDYHRQSKGEMAYSTYYHQRTLSDEEITSDEESIIGFSSFDHSQVYRRQSETLSMERASSLDLSPPLPNTGVRPSVRRKSTPSTDIHLSRTKGDDPEVWHITPTILLVDDNKINLQLLEAFMRKRRCASVKSAVNGQLAVEAVERSTGFDVILMDISMPILNGFQATRAIRAIEASRQTEKYSQQPPRRALIVALTGLASARDRAEAFAAGVDLYMIKPVSLRAVGRLLDEWEAKNGENVGVDRDLDVGSNVDGDDSKDRKDVK